MSLLKPQATNKLNHDGVVIMLALSYFLHGITEDPPEWKEEDSLTKDGKYGLHCNKMSRAQVQLLFIGNKKKNMQTFFF